jgi:PTH1 family peptidyl-tRNA hydrolase
MERNPIPVERLIVIYDEVELAEGVVDLRLCTGDAGNNGLRSIIDTIENPDFRLIRIGVGGPLGMRRSLFDPNMILRHVLSQPGPETRTLLDKAIDRGCEAVEAIVMRGWDHAVDEWEAVRIEKS